MGRNAFNFAEVMITITIIGVVAALTMPGIVAHYHEKEYVTQLQKSLSQFEQAMQNIMFRYECTDIVCTGAFDGTASDAEWNKKFEKEMTKSIKIIKTAKNIPIIVISAGVGNIIEQFLIKNNCNYPNIYICSNFLEYENGIVKSVRDNNLIHPLNKNEVFLPENIKSKIENRSNILLLGNSVSDIKMAEGNKNVFKLGFLDENIEERLTSFKEHYDIVCTNNTGYDEICNKVKILGQKMKKE